MEAGVRGVKVKVEMGVVNSRLNFLESNWREASSLRSRGRM